MITTHGPANPILSLQKEFGDSGGCKAFLLEKDTVEPFPLCYVLAALITMFELHDCQVRMDLKDTGHKDLPTHQNPYPESDDRAPGHRSDSW